MSGSGGTNIPAMLAAGERQHAEKFQHPSASKRTGGPGAQRDPLARLPSDVTDNRMLITKEAAAICGYSADQWRELYQNGLAPPPVKLSTRRTLGAIGLCSIG